MTRCTRSVPNQERSVLRHCLKRWQRSFVTSPSRPSAPVIVRTYARVDIRLDAEMNPFVLEINSMASLGPTGSYVLAAQTAGYSFDGLIGRIVDVAHRRYFLKPTQAEQYNAEQL